MIEAGAEGAAGERPRPDWVTRGWAPAAGKDQRLLFGKRTSFDAFKRISNSTMVGCRPEL
jgi:hypothetical protein